MRLTAWLRPRKEGVIDPARAFEVSRKPVPVREYADRRELAAQTDAEPADRELLKAYCSTMGIRVVDEPWRSAVLSATAGQFIEAFGATVATFADADGARFRHRSGSLHAPPEIARIVRGVFGLHQWPRSRRLGALQRHATPLSAAGVADRYSFPQADGTGQTIGIVQFRGEFRADDFDASMQAQGVHPQQPAVKRVDGAALSHEFVTVKDLEAAMDSQIAASLAPGARIVLYQAPDDERGFLDAIRAAIFDEEYKPGVLSISFGWPEFLWTPVALDLLNELFAVAALTGVSVFCSSGDNGAELDYDGKPHVLAPASSPFVHACGATSIAADAAGIQHEEPWEKSGGGTSAHFAAPPWQTGAARGVPDVCAQQQPGYCVYLEGTELAGGGTSAIAPVWAALTARLNQRLGKAAGLFTPLLYGAYHPSRAWNPATGLGVQSGGAVEAAVRGELLER